MGLNRQISRALGVMGPSGRWRRNLINKCLTSGQPIEQAVDNHEISPKVRQLLQHWGYRLLLNDVEARPNTSSKKKKKSAT
jgi:hypothetical protein